MAKIRKNYLSGPEMMAEFVKSREQDEPTRDFTRAYMKMVDRLATRGNFRGYSFLDDMKANAYLCFARSWRKFNPEKSANIFGYFTQMAWRRFLENIKTEKAIGDFRKEMMAEAGAGWYGKDGGQDIEARRDSSQD